LVGETEITTFGDSLERVWVRLVGNWVRGKSPGWEFGGLGENFNGLRLFHPKGLTNPVPLL